ncbi:cation-translocating P-type ATPase [Caproiciproducens galactitolivorans]|uniref:Cation-transporting P-type ATPase n=1 Tax=Caproiciproducens galactitolivorans TaxID=642589 RepID=A0ABT4BSH9_9FIRM|nr:cation-transporting P-type ATPase [Caproiciproducens galactitolivorans]MCY1713804.1 cation-transporting P-type ATPase [Caproiciproducens galactitolivorans]
MEEKNRVQIDENTEGIYKLTESEACKAMNSGPKGLTAEQVKENQEKYGGNVISQKKGKPVILVFLSNFISLMAILLWIGGIIAFVAGMPELGVAIWMVNVINGVFSFWQEHRASKATEALKKMLPSYARVIRDGQEQQIPAENLVPGDIMLIEEGDKISADARLLTSSDLQVNQSTLTGESNPVRKMHDPVLKEGLSRFEIPNLIFTGTSVASGTARAVVVAIGMKTEFGKIANLTQTMKEEQSPLQKELNILTKQISLIAIGIGLAFFLAAFFFVKQPFAQAFIFALGMIVAFIPEGLLPTVTLSLAMAVQRMAKEHALVKRLSAVETLGCTTVICSDKTGTLTQNEMTVTHAWLPGQEFDVTGLGYAPEGKIMAGDKEVAASGNPDLKMLLIAAGLCSNARVVPPNEENDRYTVLGDPTEACLGVVAQKAGIDLRQQVELTPRLRELPFDSRRKRMSTIHQLEKPVNGCQRIAYIKGAPKEVMELCTGVYQNGARIDMTEEQRAEIMKENDKYASMGLRVLAVACRYLGKDDNLPAAMSAYTPELIEQNMIFIGLVVMMDPPRPEVADAVEQCHRANIRIIMITGDYGLTAESIAKRIGIVRGEHPRIVAGVELEKMSDEELKTVLKEEVIFARVAPEQKYQVVVALQELGHIVAVTGDGVNDSPALKKADIGVAMGISGTDVAKEAAEMILTDDNFASIVKAIQEGRAVYSNIRKFLLYIFNSNMSEAVPSAAFLFSRGGIPLPLTVMQILSIDLGTDMLPALGLGTEMPEEGIMDRPPRSTKETLLNKRLVILAFFWYGLIESAVSMAAYFFVNMLHGWPGVPLASSGMVYTQATTMALASIVFCQIGVVECARTERQSIFKTGLFTNKNIIRGIVFEIFLITAIMYVPFLQDIFQTASIGWKHWIFLVFCPVPIVALDELRKAYLRRIHIKEHGGK